MKAKELISILQLNPEAEILVSTVNYYEKNFQDFGYKRGSDQEVVCVSLNKETGMVHLEGGEERKNLKEV